jgi:hypothetical protein
MTILSLQRLVARPRARRRTAVTAVIRNSGAARRPRRTYRDSFFADPAAVEDDSIRMRRRDTPAR